ncbi:hypothetical protein QBC39DRAFT_331145 [Podospora conica]|nr:hypothetical protein QBC39DRAFT_331145 [Schizothecium conicum]
MPNNFAKAHQFSKTRRLPITEIPSPASNVQEPSPLGFLRPNPKRPLENQEEVVIVPVLATVTKEELGLTEQLVTTLAQSLVEQDRFNIVRGRSQEDGDKSPAASQYHLSKKSPYTSKATTTFLPTNLPIQARRIPIHTGWPLVACVAAAFPLAHHETEDEIHDLFHPSDIVHLTGYLDGLQRIPHIADSSPAITTHLDSLKQLDTYFSSPDYDYVSAQSLTEILTILRVPWTYNFRVTNRFCDSTPGWASKLPSKARILATRYCDPDTGAPPNIQISTALANMGMSHLLEAKIWELWLIEVQPER